MLLRKKGVSKKGVSKALGIFFVGALAVVLAMSLVSSGFWDSIRASITGRATSQTFNLNISAGNSAPNITAVYIGTSYDPTEQGPTGNITSVTFYFTANDSDGYQNIDTTSAKANFTFYNATSTIVRTNTSCSSLGSIESKTLNFSCTIALWYFDPQSALWGVTAYVQDNSAAVGQNTTKNFTYANLKAFKIHPTAFTFASINPGSTNTSSNNDPLVLNNTGNYHFAQTTQNITVNATDLVGEANSAYALYANNFTVGNTTGGSPLIECGGAGNLSAGGSFFMTKSANKNITSAVVGYGNLSAGSGTGQGNLYICLTKAGNEITSQAYSTNGPNSNGAWTVATTW